MSRESSRDQSIAALFTSPLLTENPYKIYGRLLREAPIWNLPDGRPVFSRYEDCMAILRDHEIFGKTPNPRHDGPSMTAMDPPEHTRVRGQVSRAFTPRAISRVRGEISRTADELIGRFAPLGQCDLVPEFAKPLPTRMITQMLGIPPEDEPIWEGWANTIHDATAEPAFSAEQIAKVESMTAAAGEASRAEAEYFRELVNRRRGQGGDDIMAKLISIQEEGDTLSEEELLFTLVLLLGAGHHTSVNLISNGMVALLRHPDQLEKLRANPDLLENAIEEMLRWEPVLHMSARLARRDTELSGHPIKKGETVMVLLGAANRDPEIFEDPDRFDITRKNARRHLALGFGVHVCLGAALARSEAEVAFSMLLERLPDLRLAGEPRLDGKYNLRGHASVPLSWSTN